MWNPTPLNILAFLLWLYNLIPMLSTSYLKFRFWIQFYLEELKMVHWIWIQKYALLMHLSHFFLRWIRNYFVIVWTFARDAKYSACKSWSFIELDTRFDISIFESFTHFIHLPYFLKILFFISFLELLRIKKFSMRIRIVIILKEWIKYH